jgi:prepilin-type N-terminal cleavage/methylation domain-containing protein
MINKFSYFGLRAGSSGLTAIELMITLAVFAIMASLAAPPMPSISGNFL